MLAGVIGGLASIASLNAQRETFVPSSDVSFKISVERTNYQAGESIMLKYRIKNVSNGTVFVPKEWEATCPGGPHLWAWFEDRTGKHFVPGYAGSCVGGPINLSERMSKEAVLLSPDEHVDGTFELVTTLFGGLKPGEYRVEAALTGWTESKFTEADISELAKMAAPFMTGEVSDSVRITLTPRTK